jgi:hypothetical protein
MEKAIATAAGLSVAQVEEGLSDHHAISVGNTFTDSDAPQALLDVRAKAILKAPSSNATMGQFDVDAIDVARHMEAAAIPDDIKTFLQYLKDLA